MMLLNTILLWIASQAIAANIPNTRQLHDPPETTDEAGICSVEIDMIKTQFPNAHPCTCSSSNVTDGAGASLECQDCQYCGLGICAERTLTNSVTYATDGSRSGDLVKQCYEFTMEELPMKGDTICLSESLSDSPFCSLDVDGTSCRLCEYVDCGDGSRQPLVNCSNFREDYVFNLCEDVTVPDRYSPFFVFDSRFDNQNCTSSSTEHFVVGSRIAKMMTFGLAFAVLCL